MERLKLIFLLFGYILSANGSLSSMLKPNLRGNYFYPWPKQIFGFLQFNRRDVNAESGIVLMNTI